ncbi:MAG: ribosome-binding factor A [Parcubacteria group bacterium]|nr:ribosome-binding factor A [Parcubacteria group bacterium]|tara:strand:+ start:2040 stop:2381 length:342 start_codon:yes stop_codon:yes gene_type:complete
MSHRILQINELIRQELNNLILTEIELPKNSLATIIKVETSKDLRHAKVWLSIIPTSYTKKVLDRFRGKAGHLQYLLNKKLTMKPLPRLSFDIDETERKAGGIEELLDRIREKG